MLNIVLVEPEIPQNTGNISRTCVVTSSRLHIIRPMKFAITDATVKRAGLDYWDRLSLNYYDSFDKFLSLHPGAKCYYATAKAKHSYTDIAYTDECYLIFGKESVGLGEELIAKHSDEAIRIPMMQDERCLNLSNSVAVILYEALRQLSFPNMI